MYFVLFFTPAPTVATTTHTHTHTFTLFLFCFERTTIALFMWNIKHNLLLLRLKQLKSLKEAVNFLN